MTKLMFPKNALKQHVGYLGSNGTGKTQGMMQIFDNVIDQKKVIIDVKGDYTSIYYNEDKDIIFCPFDKRSIGWNIFNDIETYQDATAIAAALVPENPKVKDPYWDNAARNIVEAVLLYLFKTKTEPKNKDLWNTITSFDAIAKIRNEDKECASLIDYYINVEEQRHTREVLGTITAKTTVRSLQYLSKVDGDFSFKEWINSSLKNNLFLLADPKIINAVLPLYRIGIEIIALELLSMPDDDTREFYFWLDEFPKLQKLEKVIDLLTLVRSKGGRVIYSLQEFQHLEEIYGKELARTIIGNTNTLFIYRTINAEFLEKLLGQQEVLEYSESRSMGPSDISDRINASKSKKTKALVLGSEIQRLANLEFYLKTIAPDITKAKLKYKKREAKNPKFISNIEKIQKQIVTLPDDMPSLDDLDDLDDL
ncbi:type IV secretion system DNA-binding domain-containing protein [Hydrogenimonas thermophila]|uniref:type IV secretion system DNA-binding domain-containing protein n=1 Tax=Hydrogenimonas thermophila TaxID=223786 RepID=UPI002937336F|nr:type IV secretion system DNA-binding domain-containing protein [Hydrogenimonas thermophila]WOE70483.1 type IV secretion system DNA-binding domain-containing protein [Hydrogenimonas thermophila]WOE73000.1 type IV secretion system DNA-binding domain-containing protein [Hydrogenimonas thermophila]